MPTARWPTAPTAENTSTTLNGSITSSATSVVVNDASKLAAPCYIVIDRVDASGNVQTTSLWEYVLVTAISTNTLTVTRAQGGSTAQSHNNAAVVEAVVTAAAWEDQRTALQVEHDTAGLHVIALATIARMNLTSVATITTAFFATRADASGASITGFARTFVWYMPGFASAATTNVMRIINPFGGTFQSFSMTTRTPVSAASLTIALYNIRSGASIFDTIGRPAILGGGTFVSTASIKTPNFISGDVLRSDIETGGNVADITLEGIAY